MKKILIPIIVSVGIIWGLIFANSGGTPPPEPFPDTAEMPRVPTADGTIWGFLKWLLGLSSGNDVLHYAGSGGVQGARMLSGVTADKLLAASAPCSDPNQVVIWIENWALKCGTITRILAQLWTIESMSGTAKAYTYHASGSYEEITPSTLMYQGDVIHTEPWKSVTLAFLDKSILRIDEDTTVSLSIWNIPSTGQSLAYAILEAGGLWWRVLTETGGYFIGNTDLVAWVRGTSVSLVTTGVNIAYSPIHPDSAGISWSGAVKRWEVAKTGTPTTTLAIVQSQASGKAATVTCKDGTTQTERDAFSGSVYRLSGSNCSTMQSERFTTASGIYNSTYNVWSRFDKNTLADLEYMSGIISSVSLTPTQKQKIVNEFEVTRPKSADDKKAVCRGEWTDMTYWENLVGTHFESACQGEKVLAVASYVWANANANLYGKNSSINATLPTGVAVSSNGVLIDQAGEYIKYSKTRLQTLMPAGQTLGGKKVKIYFDSLPNTLNRSILGINSTDRVSVKPDWTIWCSAWWSCWVTQDMINKSVEITLPENSKIQDLIIGNDLPNYNHPIGVTVKKIEVIGVVN